MTQYYECHITMIGIPSVVKPIVEANKWKFSAIDGDPVLGDGVKCYATMLFSKNKPYDDILFDLHKVAIAVQNSGVKVLRRKIEFVLFDDRSKDVVCDGSCCALGESK